MKNRSLLAEVTDKLSKLNHSPTVDEEIVNEGLVIGEAKAQDDNADPNDDADGNMAQNFEDENGQDGPKAIEYTRTLKIEYDPANVKFWFIQLENEMFTCEVKSQWLKRCVLVKNLPPKVQSDVMALLCLQKAEAPADLYKQIKQELMRIHAPKKEDTFKKALSRVLVGLPSQLGQTLLNDICDKTPKLTGCCCAKSVYTLWVLQLPAAVRAAVADREFSATTYTDIFQSADKVFLSTRDTEVNPAVAAIAGIKKSGEEAQVAAVRPPPKNKGGNRGGGGQSGGQQSGGQQSSSNQKGQGRGPRHKSNPPSACCDSHYRYGDKSWNCLSPFTCPWKDKLSPRPGKKNNSSNNSSQ